MVGIFYAKVTDDPELEPYFAGVDDVAIGEVARLLPPLQPEIVTR